MKERKDQELVCEYCQKKILPEHGVKHLHCEGSYCESACEQFDEEKEIALRSWAVDQPIDGFLYDLDLLPEQHSSKRDQLLHSAILTLRKEIEKCTQE